MQVVGSYFRYSYDRMKLLCKKVEELCRHYMRREFLFFCYFPKIISSNEKKKEAECGLISK